MPPRSEQQLMSQLRECEADPALPGIETVLRDALESPHARCVARGARIAGEQKLETLEAELRAAYDRLLEEPVQTDPGCVAKTAICEALRLVDHHDGEFFLDGIQYQQLEPVRGGSVDTADRLRATCGFALIQQSHPRALSELVDLLADPEKTARAGAARAIAHAGGETAELLLRMKLQAGDNDYEVLAECFAGLLRINPQENVARVAKYLDHHSVDISCEAALALGESRMTSAFPHLKAQAERRQTRDYERVLLLAIGLLGSSESVDYLLDIVAGRDTGAATTAIEALGHCRDRSSFADRLKTIVDQAGNRALSRGLENYFPELVTGEQPL